MKLIYLLITLFSTTAISTYSTASLLSNQLEKGEWTTAKSPFVCKLEQTIPEFGSVEFTKVPQQKIRVSFIPHSDVEVTDVSMAHVASEFKLDISPLDVNFIKGQRDDVNQFTFAAGTNRFLEAVRTGDRLLVERQSNEGTQSAIYRSIFGNRSIAQFRSCITYMSPLTWSDAKFTEFYFNSNQVQLTRSDKRRVEQLLAYLPFDNSIVKIMVDGHSDDAGNNLANRMLSQERADEVASNLIELGLDRSLLEVRAHGNRYPRSENNQSSTNKRVTIRLVKKIN